MNRIALWLAVCVTALACAPVTTRPAPNPSSSRSTMHEFALIFRATSPVAAADLPARNAAARDWALALREQGILRSASPLQDDGRVVHSRGVTPISSGAIASVLIVEAASLDAATSLAQGHPGLAFGTEIEIRPLKAVALPGR